MRLGGRLAGAIEVLTDIENRRRPVADALKDWGLSRRFAGSGDRAAVGNIVYDALRKKLSHVWLMDDASPAALAHAVMFRQWHISSEQLAAELDGDKFAPEPLSAAALAAFRDRRLDDAPDHVQGDIPEWVVPLFQENFGEGWLVEAQALAERPSLDLRTNTLRADRAKVVSALDEAQAVPARIARQGVRILPGEGPSRLPNITAELSFAKGWFEVQDEGSQIVADLTMAQDGEQVLDYCAGGGGKTLALSATMNNKGQVHAFDADRKRLAPIIERLRRAGTRNVQVHEREKDLVHLVGKCDRVLVDAPCTGTGTWRRRPDTKWRLTQKNLDERIEQQRQVLASAMRYVRPGGMLCYVTCSLLPQENQEQVRHFVAGNSDFEVASATDDWQALFGASGIQPVSDDGATVTLSPASTDTDGFFFARMHRKG